MAGLTIKDFKGKHGETRIVALLEKLIEGQKSPFTTVDGKQQPFNKITYPDPRTGRLVTKSALDISDSSDIANIIRTGAVSFKQIQLSYERNSRVTNLVPLSDILKTEDFGGKANRGDMAEVIFSAAIVCRFLNKNQPVIEGDVIDMIKQLNDTDTHQLLGPMKSPNKEPKVIDDLYWEVNSALINIKALKNPRHVRNLKSIISSSVKYANSTAVANNAKIVYENSLYNKIAVKAIGTVAQSDTKVDVYVEIDDVKVNINVSLKAGGTKQFGQVGGGTLDKQKDLWSTLLDFKVTPSMEKKYYDTLKSDGLIAANTVVYKSMADEFNRRMTSNDDAVYKSLSDGIMFYGTRNDDTVDMVSLTSKEAMIYKFQNLQTSLHLTNSKLKALFVSNKTKPEVRIQDSKTGAILITIRLKGETKNNYVRHYIEKGKLMTGLVGLVAT
jgi:cold shock CspA family protein